MKVVSGKRRKHRVCKNCVQEGLRYKSTGVEEVRQYNESLFRLVLLHCEGENDMNASFTLMTCNGRFAHVRVKNVPHIHLELTSVETSLASEQW